MSSRALRKAQREREEQEQLRKVQEEAEDAEESAEDNVALPPAKKSAFEILADAEDEDEAEAGDGGVPVEEHSDEPSTERSATNESTPHPAVTKSKKKKKKKSKAKAGVRSRTDTPEPEAQEELDEIDAALRQLSTKSNGVTATTAAGVDSEIDEACRLLAIDTQHLHAQNEMKRLFGRAALEQDEEERPAAPQAAGGNRRQQRRVQQVGLAQALRGGPQTGMRAQSLKRNIFIAGKEDWPLATTGGLGMEVVSKHADGTIEYRFVHNRTYQDVQSQFQSCVASMDPNRLVVLLQHNPYHISTLLQVSEIAKSERDHATAGDLLERALFSFGRAIHSTFAKALGEGKARLDFRRPENREFWLAAWRYMQNLMMRGTWRTVYEWAKLLLSLAPDSDPYALWLVLDQYALRARQDLDYLNISRNPHFADVHNKMPNVALSQGLAEYRAGNKGKGKQVLFTAIGRYPWIVFRLFQELSLDAPPAVWGKEPTTEREKLHCELYATRAKDLWNTPEYSALLTEIASALPPDTLAAVLDNSEIIESEARHVLCDTPALIALIPREFTAQMTSSSDPLPPADSISSYTITSTQPSNPHPQLRTAGENIRELEGLYGFFRNLFPWFNAQGGETNGAEAQPSEEEIERRIRDSGVDEETIAARTQRMMQLQQQLMGDVPNEDGEEFPGGMDGEMRAAADIHAAQARVEDASNEEAER